MRRLPTRLSTVAVLSALLVGLVGVTSAQAAAPTISSFTPTCGPEGTSVTITGNYFQDSSVVTAVELFNGVSSATLTVNSDTQITATVPTGATSGPISVTTPGGTTNSSTNFTVGTAVTTHDRSVTLNLSGHLTANGVVTAADGFADCENGMTVKIQKRRRHGGWRTVATTTTDATGVHQVDISDRPGSYRALAVKETIGSDVCSKDTSPRRRHGH